MLASTSLAGVPAVLAQEPEAAQDAATLEEVVVTAQKRSESLQKVPFSIQALGTEKLEELQIQDFRDAAKFLPGVSYQTIQPGLTSVYMRGVASGNDGNHSGSLPSVGLYLDEQPVTTIQGPLDIHMYDIARVEALAGPQGTLYGASSQAGTIRIITNKPSSAGFEGAWDVGVNSVAHGGVGYFGQGFVNAPLSDKVAVRLVGWAEHDAGYIDNVKGTMTFPTAGVTIDNASRAKDDYNDVDTYGARAALRIDLNDNWTVTPTVIAQDMKSNGISGFDPDKGDLKVTHFYPESTHDRWVQAAMTIEGRVSNFDLVYAGAYMKRDVDIEQDYSDYSFFYDTLYGYYLVDDGNNMINPSQYIQAKDGYTKETHEFRVSSPADKRLRAIAGVFYQKQFHDITQRYRVDNLASSLEVTGWADTLWLTRQERVDRDYAVFGELTFDVTDKLKATGGVRFFKADNGLKGFFGFGAGYDPSPTGNGEAACIAPTPVVPGGPCTSFDKSVEETGSTHKLNLTYQIDDDRMVYATWSTGYRPGGLNRRGTLPPYKSDFLTNYELGWKTTWPDQRLRFNGAVFLEQWDDFQFSMLGPNGLTEIRNAGQAEVKGAETELSWRPTGGLTISGAAAYTDAKLSKPYCRQAFVPGACPPYDSPEGTQLPVTPKVKASLIARQEFVLGGLDAHVQAALAYQSSAWPDLRVYERGIMGRMPGFTTADFMAGIEHDAWSLELSLTNAFDERGEVHRFAECAEATCGETTYTVPIRPRTVGLKVGRRF